MNRLMPRMAKKAVGFWFQILLGVFGWAITVSQAGNLTVSQAIKRELESRYPGAALIEVSVADQINEEENTAEPKRTSAVEIINEDGRGVLTFRAEGEESRAKYRVLLPARQSTRRIFPGEKLEEKDFITKNIDVSMGLHFQTRGLLLSPNQDLSRLESRQTLIEGQPVLTSAVQRMPDVRKGDVVKVSILSGDLSLSTLGTATENAYIESSVRIMTQKTKRELVGKLSESGVVEVKL